MKEIQRDITELLAWRSEQEVLNNQQDIVSGEQHIAELDITLFEMQCQEEWENNHLLEMANIFPRTHGIPDVVLWVGETDKRHWLRVKVSNVRNKMDHSNTFFIKMPSLDCDESKVAKWVPLEDIRTWIKINQQPLYDYEMGKIQDTGLFLDMLTKL